MMSKTHFTWTHSSRNIIQILCILCVIHRFPVSSASMLCDSIKFDGKCTCGMAEYDQKQQYIVNCTNSGFQNTTMLEYMPSQVEVVIFTGNYLHDLPWNIFGRINEYPKLRIIDMSNNHIRDIRGKTYHHVQLVERLILNHNNLSISANDQEGNHLHPRIFSNFINLRSLHLTNAFEDYTSSALSQDLHLVFVNSNLTKLAKLHLEQNEIQKFKDRNVFCDLPELQDLHLGDNNLDEISFNVRCLKNLRFLDLERNRFETVHKQDLDDLTSLENSEGRKEDLVVDFSGNLFVCDCSTFHFVEWLQSSRVTVRRKQELMCTRHIDHTEPLMSQTFRNCAVMSHEHYNGTRYQVTLVFLLVVLLFIMAALIGALLYVSKDRIRYFVSPVVSTRKVQYTTIRDNEVQEAYV